MVHIPGTQEMIGVIGRWASVRPHRAVSTEGKLALQRPGDSLSLPPISPELLQNCRCTPHLTFFSFLFFFTGVPRVEVTVLYSSSFYLLSCLPALFSFNNQIFRCKQTNKNKQKMVSGALLCILRKAHCALPLGFSQSYWPKGDGLLTSEWRGFQWYRCKSVSIFRFRNRLISASVSADCIGWLFYTPDEREGADLSHGSGAQYTTVEKAGQWTKPSLWWGTMWPGLTSYRGPWV